MTPLDELQIWYLFIIFMIVAAAVAFGSLSRNQYSDKERKASDDHEIESMSKYSDIKRLRKQAKALRH